MARSPKLHGMGKLAVFDLDGTLVDSAPDLHSALDRLVVAEGRAGFARTEVTVMIGDGVRVLVERALAARGLAFSEALLARFTADYTAHAAAATRLFPGVAAALAALRAVGWRLAVCTNKPAAATAAVLEQLGVAGFFAAIGAGDSFPTRKPDPAHLLATVGLAGGGPAAMIGDHRNDMLAAQGAGIPAVFARWGYGPPDMAQGAAAEADRPDALPELLERLLSSPAARPRSA